MNEAELCKAIRRIATRVRESIRACPQYNPPNPRAMGAHIAIGGKAAILALMAAAKGSAAQHALREAFEGIQFEVTLLELKPGPETRNWSNQAYQKLLDLG